MLLALVVLLWAGFWIGEVAASGMQSQHPTYARILTFLLFLFFWWIVVPLHALTRMKNK